MCDLVHIIYIYIYIYIYHIYVHTVVGGKLFGMADDGMHQGSGEYRVFYPFLLFSSGHVIMYHVVDTHRVGHALVV